MRTMVFLLETMALLLPPVLVTMVLVMPLLLTMVLVSTLALLLVW